MLRLSLSMDCKLPCMLWPAYSEGGICPSAFSNASELLLVLGLHTNIGRCHRFDSETVFGPDRAVVASSSSCFPSSLHLGPRDPRLEMRLAVRLAAIRIRLVIRLCVWTHCPQPQPCRGFRVSCQRPFFFFLFVISCLLSRYMRPVRAMAAACRCPRGQQPIFSAFKKQILSPTG